MSLKWAKWAEVLSRVRKGPELRLELLILKDGGWRAGLRGPGAGREMYKMG